MAYAIIGIRKLKGSSVGSSDAHADRARETPNADEKLLDKNIYLRGGKTPLRVLVDKVIKESGGKPRKDSVECIELMLTASPEYFSSPEKTNAFIEKLKEYIPILEERGLIVVKALVHLDETTPHGSFFVVPLGENGKLNAKSHIGTRAKMAGFQDEFAQLMQPLGLKRGTRRSHATHHDVKQFYDTIISEPELNLTARCVPDPPRSVKSDEQRIIYKNEVIEAVRAEVIPQIAQMRNQAMLTNHYKGFKEAAEERAANLEDELKSRAVKLENTEAKLKNTDDKLAESQAKLQKLRDTEDEFVETKKQLIALQIKQTDLSFTKVSQVFTGQTGAPSKTGETYFSDDAGQLSFYIKENSAYAVSGEKYAENSIELSQRILKEQGRAGTLPEVVAGLAGHFNDEEITNAVSHYAYRKAQASLLHQTVAEAVKPEAIKAVDEIFPSDETDKAKINSSPDEIPRADDDEELFEALDKILPNETVDSISLSGKAINAEDKNQNEVLSKKIITEKNESYGEIEEIVFKQVTKSDSSTKSSEKLTKEIEEISKSSEVTVAKVQNDAAAESKLVEKVKPEVETVLTKKIAVTPIDLNAPALQNIKTLPKTAVFDNILDTGKSLEVSESSETLKQVVKVPVLLKGDGIKKADKNLSAEINQPEINNQKQSETLKQEENRQPVEQSIRRAVEDSSAPETLPAQISQPSLFEITEKAPVQNEHGNKRSDANTVSYPVNVQLPEEVQKASTSRQNSQDNLSISSDLQQTIRTENFSSQNIIEEEVVETRNTEDAKLTIPGRRSDKLFVSPERILNESVESNQVDTAELRVETNSQKQIGEQTNTSSKVIRRDLEEPKKSVPLKIRETAEPNIDPVDNNQTPERENTLESANNNQVPSSQPATDLKAEIRPTFSGEGVDTSKTENASDKEFFVEKPKNISRPADELTEKHKNKPVREIKEIQVSDAADSYEKNRVVLSQTAINTDSETQTDAEIQEADKDFIAAVVPTALQPEAAQTENKSETKKEAETQTKESEEIFASGQEKPVEIQIKNEQIAESPVDGKKITFDEQTTAPGEIESQTPVTVKEAKIEITPANERIPEYQFENAESLTDLLPIEDKNISTEIPISRTIEAEPETASITAETEEIPFTAQMNSDYSNDYSSDNFYRSEQERIAAENIAGQNRQFQITLEQNNKQSQVQQENYQEAIDAITRNFK